MNISESFQLVIDDKLNFSRFGGCPGEDPGKFFYKKSTRKWEISNFWGDAFLCMMGNSGEGPFSPGLQNRCSDALLAPHASTDSLMEPLRLVIPGFVYGRLARSALRPPNFLVIHGLMPLLETRLRRNLEEKVILKIPLKPL